MSQSSIKYSRPGHKHPLSFLQKGNTLTRFFKARNTPSLVSKDWVKIKWHIARLDWQMKRSYTELATRVITQSKSWPNAIYSEERPVGYMNTGFVLVTESINKIRRGSRFLHTTATILHTGSVTFRVWRRRWTQQNRRTDAFDRRFYTVAQDSTRRKVAEWPIATYTAAFLPDSGSPGRKVEVHREPRWPRVEYNFALKYAKQMWNSSPELAAVAPLEGRL